VGVSQAAIARIENGALLCSDDLISVIAVKTHQPLRFFYQSPAPEFPIGSLLFRAHASMTQKEITVTYRYAQQALEVWERLRSGLRAIAVKIPKLSMHAITAAREARSAFGIPRNEPIPHLLNLLEWNGLVALVVPDLNSRDAFSLWHEDLPIMALSRGRPGDRSRMNAAHELGHLVQHCGKSRFEVDDTEADDFAAEFLMPEIALRKEIKSPVTINVFSDLQNVIFGYFSRNFIGHRSEFLSRMAPPSGQFASDALHQPRSNPGVARRDHPPRL
jgi:hypothetical protein